MFQLSDQSFQLPFRDKLLTLVLQIRSLKRTALQEIHFYQMNNAKLTDENYWQSATYCSNYCSNSVHLFYDMFLWDDSRKDQWSEINGIMKYQRNRWILIQNNNNNNNNNTLLPHRNFTYLVCKSRVDLPVSLTLHDSSQISYHRSFFFGSSQRKVPLDWWLWSLKTARALSHFS